MICQQCGKEFTPQAAFQKYCSLACRNIQRYGNRKCVVCGKIFTPRQPNQIICSKECIVEHVREQKRDYKRAHAKHVDYPPRQCVICGKTFETNHSRKITCSPECSAENNRRKQIELRKSIPVNYEPVSPTTCCQNCGRPTSPDVMQGRFCSDDCILEFFTPPKLMRLARLLEGVNK